MAEEVSSETSRPRILASGSRDGRWQFRAVDLSAVVSAVGTRLFAACMKCFVGIGRLVTFEQMLVFNVRELKLESAAKHPRAPCRAALDEIRDPRHRRFR